MSKTIFTKTTGKGAVLVVTVEGKVLSATVDGKPIAAAIRYLDAPKVVGGKTVVAQIGAIGLTSEELDAIELGWRGPPPAPVEAKYERAKSYTAEDAAWDRGFERKHTGE